MSEYKLALGVISGRVINLDVDDYEKLGYHTYNFSYYGKPDINEVKDRCEDIIFDAIKKASYAVPIIEGK